MSSQTAFYESMIEYSEAIMLKCIQDSEEAVRSISKVIDFLLSDSGRISKMSSDTLNAVKNLESVISEVDQKTTAATLKKLIVALSGLVKEHRSVNDVIMPIVEALQFQDSIRQQMENLGKVMKIWIATRIELGSNLTADQEVAFGEKLLKVTTMYSEREIIRRYIPGLPEEQKAAEVTLF